MKGHVLAEELGENLDRPGMLLEALRQLGETSGIAARGGTSHQPQLQEQARVLQVVQLSGSIRSRWLAPAAI